MKKKVLTGCLCALGCEVLFGLSYLFTKQAADEAGVLALLGWRFVIAAAVMSVCAAAGLLPIHLKGKKLRPLLLVALMNPLVYFVAETAGISLTTASESGVFLACIPAFSIAGSTFLLHKKPTRWQIIGVAATLLGVLVTVLAVDAAASLSLPGYALLLVAVISYALYGVFVEKAQGYSGAEMTFVMMLCAAAVFGTLALTQAAASGTLDQLISLPIRSQTFLTAILYQGVGCSVCAFFMSNVAIASIGVNRTASFIGVATVVSIAAGVVLLGEPFTIAQLIGAALIVAGVYIANIASKKDQA